MRFNVDFDKECRKHGYDGMQEFEDSIVQELYKYKELDFMCPSGPGKKVQWIMDSLKKYYDIDTYIDANTIGSFYTCIHCRRKNFVDDYTLNNYFI